MIFNMRYYELANLFAWFNTIQTHNFEESLQYWQLAADRVGDAKMKHFMLSKARYTRYGWYSSERDKA